MSEEWLLVEKAEGICTFIINRPDRRNSVNPEIMLQMGNTLNALKDDPIVRVVVIRGAGDKAFSSGFDISRIPTGGREEDITTPQPLYYGLEAIEKYPYPVIAMISGYAVGAGLEIAVTCDLRIAADNARLGITPAKLGVVYGARGLQRFINLVGVAQTKELFYTGRLIDAPRAREIGLVDHVVPPEQLSTFTYQMAQEIAENSHLSIAGTKAIIAKLLKYQVLSPQDEAEIQALQAQSFLSQDLKEGQRAFIEKRKPKFIGR